MTQLILPITFGDLITMAGSFRARHPGHRPLPEAMRYEMAATLIRSYLGDRWCDDNVLGHAEPYLKPKSADPFEEMKVQARVEALGELIFNLQDVEGGRARIARIADASLEVAISDLEAARLIALNDYPFRFVAETRVKGADYDIELTPAPGVTLCCESKCKVEATAHSEATILESLRHAAGQLPKHAPGVVFMKWPESWINSSQAATSLRTALRRFFGQSGRVVEVVLHWEEWRPVTSRGEFRGVFRGAKYHEYINEKSRFFTPGLIPLFRPWSPIWTPRTNWRRFVDAIRSAGA